MPAPWPATNDELKEASCWFAVDQVPKRPDVTEFKRRARWQQSWWRETAGLDIGQHFSGTPRVGRNNGSRIALTSARATGANFLSDSIRSGVKERLAKRQEHETLDEDRLWSDLLSSMPMCFNLFGEATDPHRLSAAADVLWPGHPGQPAALRFEWSPGRRDELYLANRSAFDVALELDLGDGRRGVIGVETKYHEDIKAEPAPNPTSRLPRYLQVAKTSGVFRHGWEVDVIGTDLQQIWLDHLLVLSMLQHPTAGWAVGMFVVVFPAANPSVAAAVERYRSVLVNPDESAFRAVTVEDLLDAHIHTPSTEASFRDRYLW